MSLLPSDRSSPEDGAISSVESSPLLVRKMIAVNEGSIRLTGGTSHNVSHAHSPCLFTHSCSLN